MSAPRRLLHPGRQGPYHVGASSPRYIYDEGGKGVAAVEAWDGTPAEVAEVNATARLLAAAPLMYDSLDPDTLEAIADEITRPPTAFLHSARAHSLRLAAERQRAAIAAVAEPAP